MASKVIASDRAIPIYLTPGATVTFSNYDTTNDVYLNADPNELNAALIGAATTFKGAKLAHSGGQLQIAIQATGKIWARSVASAGTSTIIDVD